MDFQAIIQLLPGYDPVETAGLEGCSWDEVCDADVGEFYFATVAARKAISFFENELTFVKPPKAGDPFLLERWQKAIVANTFGWKRCDTGNRRYNEVWLYVPRKNGKTALVAGCELKMVLADGEVSPDCYIAAADTEQSRELWEHITGMVEDNDRLNNQTRLLSSYKYLEVENEMGGGLKILSHRGRTKHGKNPHSYAIDEVHAQANDELIEALETAFGSREEPIAFYMTTADVKGESICNRKHEYAQNVRDGVVDDPTVLPCIWEAEPDEDDWTDPDVWQRVNPNYGVSCLEEFMKKQARKAQNRADFENKFKRLHLNMQTQQAFRLIKMQNWNECAADFSEAELYGKPCWAGLDMASRNDLNALVLYFPDTHHILCWQWGPEDRAREREREGDYPYQTWADQGWLTITPGNVADQERILGIDEEQPPDEPNVLDIFERFNVQDVGFDRYGSDWVVVKLMDHGYEVVEFGQGWSSMSAPTKTFLNLIDSGQLQHRDNPVLNWNISNAAGKRGDGDTVKITKKESHEKVDGAVAAVMAIGRAEEAGGEPGEFTSMYSERGMVTD